MGWKGSQMAIPGVVLARAYPAVFLGPHLFHLFAGQGLQVFERQLSVLDWGFLSDTERRRSLLHPTNTLQASWKTFISYVWSSILVFSSLYQLLDQPRIFDI